MYEPDNQKFQNVYYDQQFVTISREDQIHVQCLANPISLIIDVIYVQNYQHHSDELSESLGVCNHISHRIRMYAMIMVTFTINIPEFCQHQSTIHGSYGYGKIIGFSLLFLFSVPPVLLKTQQFWGMFFQSPSLAKNGSKMTMTNYMCL